MNTRAEGVLGFRTAFYCRFADLSFNVLSRGSSSTVNYIFGKSTWRWRPLMSRFFEVKENPSIESPKKNTHKKSSWRFVSEKSNSECAFWCQPKAEKKDEPDVPPLQCLTKRKRWASAFDGHCLLYFLFICSFGIFISYIVFLLRVLVYLHFHGGSRSSHPYNRILLSSSLMSIFLEAYVFLLLFIMRLLLATSEGELILPIVFSFLIFSSLVYIFSYIFIFSFFHFVVSFSLCVLSAIQSEYAICKLLNKRIRQTSICEISYFL